MSIGIDLSYQCCQKIAILPVFFYLLSNKCPPVLGIITTPLGRISWCHFPLPQFIHPYGVHMPHLADMGEDVEAVYEKIGNEEYILLMDLQ